MKNILKIVLILFFCGGWIMVNAAENEVIFNWISAESLRVEGKGWTETELYYDRLPAKAKDMVSEPVWNLSRKSAGLVVRFNSDTPALKVRWTLRSENLALPHMPSTGVSGLDLYVRYEGDWRWLAAGRPLKQENEQTLFENITPEPREYMLFLPLYNGVSQLELASPDGVVIQPATARETRPIVWYGTSITQGGCASRPGMVASNILSRKLDREIINLGFSGNGKLEPELATLLAELDPCMYMLACLENILPEDVHDRAMAFVPVLRAAHPDVPILLLESVRFSHAFLRKETLDHLQLERAELKRAFEDLQQQGLRNLHYIYGDGLYGLDGEGAVDGVHATDLGFYRQAEYLYPLINQLLEKRYPETKSE